MQREQPVCASCGARFQFDDFVEELGELVACPYCGGLDIEIDLLAEETPRAGDEPAGEHQAEAA